MQNVLECFKEINETNLFKNDFLYLYSLFIYLPILVAKYTKLPDLYSLEIKRVPLAEQDILTLPGHLMLHPCSCRVKDMSICYLNQIDASITQQVL